ncbi:hypothetical protein BDK51DRAFT_30318 [Blyttiomyces helicus]|uniref:Bromo domain-containing protein n=1 Tax=Blyttiomyces helicus TaxID=388810 RepID=A0A4P9WEI9_9FUNG|nr:hypothetical protein BDK51DRAFT_30318 [Blyttiomyces helicus]|eukprot:RKO91141.1 hypothetical protein BDK51DRAFT_30318 [Blyttiomyces helicus]
MYSMFERRLSTRGHLGSVYNCLFDRTGSAFFTEQAVILDLCINEDNTFLASASSDRSVVVWNLQSSKPVTTIIMPKDVSTISFSPSPRDDLKCLVITCRDGKTRVYGFRKDDENAFGTLPVVLDSCERKSDRVITGSFNRTGTKFATGATDGYVCIYAMVRSADAGDSPSSAFIATPAPNAALPEPLVSPTLIAKIDATARTPTDRRRKPKEELGIKEVKFSHVGDRFCSGCSDGTTMVHRYDPESKMWTNTKLVLPEPAPRRASDASAALQARRARNLSQEEADDSGVEEHSQQTPPPAQANGLNLANADLAPFPHPDPILPAFGTQQVGPMAVGIDPAGPAEEAPDALDVNVPATAQGGGNVNGIIGLPGGGEQTGVGALNVEPGLLPAEPVPLPVEELVEHKNVGVLQLIWSLDDSRIVTIMDDGILRVWDSLSGDLIYALEGHKDVVYTLDPHPNDARVVLSAGYDGKLVLWDIVAGKELKSFQLYGDRAILCASFSPTGETLVATDVEGYTHLFSLLPGPYCARSDQWFPSDWRIVQRNPQDPLAPVIEVEYPNTAAHLAPYHTLVDSAQTPYLEYDQMRRRFGLDRPLPCSGELVDQGRELVRLLLEEEEGSPQELQEFTPVVPAPLPPKPKPKPPAREPVEEPEEDTSAMPAIPLPVSSGEEWDGDDGMDDEEEDDYDRPSGSGSKMRFDLESEDEDFIDDDDEDDEHQHGSRKRRRKKPKSSPNKKMKKGTRKKAAGKRRKAAGDAPVGGSNGADARPTRTRRTLRSDAPADLQSESESDADESWNHSESESSTPATTTPSTPYSPDPSTSRRRQPRETQKVSFSKKPIPQPRRNKAKPKPVLPSPLPTFGIDPWVQVLEPRQTPYLPQLGDVIVIIKKGYEEFCTEAAAIHPQPEIKSLNMSTYPDVVIARVDSLHFRAAPRAICTLGLCLLTAPSATSSGDIEAQPSPLPPRTDLVPTTIPYTNVLLELVDLPGTPDFVVLYDDYRRAVAVQWNVGDELVMPYIKEDSGGSVADFRGDEDVSPWEIRRPGEDAWVQQEGLDPAEKDRIVAIVERAMRPEVMEPFLDAVDVTVWHYYPVVVAYPVWLKMILARLRNDFYRHVEAVAWDVTMMHQNVKAFNEPWSDLTKVAAAHFPALHDEILGHERTVLKIKINKRRLSEKSDGGLSAPEDTPTDPSPNADDADQDDDIPVRSRRGPKRRRIIEDEEDYVEEDDSPHHADTDADADADADADGDAELDSFGSDEDAIGSDYDVGGASPARHEDPTGPRRPKRRRPWIEDDDAEEYRNGSTPPKRRSSRNGSHGGGAEVGVKPEEEGGCSRRTRSHGALEV